MRLKNEKNPSKSIHDIWEVRLDKKIIERLRRLAIQRRTTMSWLARYCIFKLVHKKKIHINKFHEMVDEFRADRPPFRELGRFYICFYGDDILWVKMKAGQLGVTVSMLVRVALLRYIDSLEGVQRVPAWRLFWYGLKFNKTVDIHRQRNHRSLVKEFLISRSFSLEDFWGIPAAPLPGFLRL